MKTIHSFLRSTPFWYFLLFSFFILNSCKNNKGLNDNSTSDANETTEMSANMKMGIVIDYSEKSTDCGFLIELENEDVVLQALKIPDELMKDGTKVWIDYTLSRRQQGPCIYGKPIIINDIKTRE